MSAAARDSGEPAPSRAPAIEDPLTDLDRAAIGGSEELLPVCQGCMEVADHELRQVLSSLYTRIELLASRETSPELGASIDACRAELARATRVLDTYLDPEALYRAVDPHLGDRVDPASILEDVAEDLGGSRELVTDLEAAPLDASRSLLEDGFEGLVTWLRGCTDETAPLVVSVHREAHAVRGFVGTRSEKLDAEAAFRELRATDLATASPLSKGVLALESHGGGLFVERRDGAWTGLGFSLPLPPGGGEAGE